MNYSTDRFIDYICSQKLKSPGLLNTSGDQLKRLQTVKRRMFEELLGLNMIRDMDFTPVYETLRSEKKDGYILTEGHYTTLPELTTPYYVLEPEKNSEEATYKGVIIYVHGHCDGAHVVVDPANSGEYQKCLPVSLVKMGYKVYVPELVGFGRVKMDVYKEDEYRGCYAVSTQLLLCGLTMAGLRVNQILAIVDNINENDAVKPILAGISGGGLVTSFTAALGADIKGAFVSGYANTFKGSIMAMFHCVDNYVPNILAVGEEPEIIAMAAPTPLLLSAGEADPIFPLEYTEEAFKAIKKIYGQFGVGDNIETEIFDGDHEISERAIYQWLERL